MQTRIIIQRALALNSRSGQRRIFCAATWMPANISMLCWGCFSGEAKILGAYHQYFAVRKAAASTANATVTDGKGGVFWHTQGSGKSLSMVFYAHLLQEALNSPTIVVLTDRNDLDDQLFGQFAKCSDFLRQAPQQAESRTHLKELISRAAGQRHHLHNRAEV